MSSYTIRPLDFRREEEVFVAASFSMLTLLETLPEARRDPGCVPNFSVEAMAEMFRENRHNPAHRYLVIEAEGGVLIGHAIALMRLDDDGARHGYSYTRYILPYHRRKGLARRLLREAKAWWCAEGAQYVTAHTHPSNHALLALFHDEGFRTVEHKAARWPSVLLRWEIDG